MKLSLTAFVPAALWSAGKKYGAAWSRMTNAREEQKRSRYKQSTLIVKDLKYGPSLSIFVQKLIMHQPLQISQFFITIITRQLSLILG